MEYIARAAKPDALPGRRVGRVVKCDHRMMKNDVSGSGIDGQT